MGKWYLICKRGIMGPSMCQSDNADNRICGAACSHSITLPVYG